MKILLLNPHVNAQHKLVLALQNAGHGVLLPGDAQEAWQMLQLHGSSVDLAVIHREGLVVTPDPRVPEPGLQLLERIKGDSTQADLPVILTSAVWKDADFGRHQQTPEGANAYLTWPYDENRLQALIRAVFSEGGTGQTGSLTGTPAPSAGGGTASGLSLPPRFTGKPSGGASAGGEGASPVLEDSSSLFNKNESGPLIDGEPEIHLEAPELTEEEADEPAGLAIESSPIPVPIPPSDPEPAIDLAGPGPGAGTGEGGGTMATMELSLDALGTGQLDLGGASSLNARPISLEGKGYDLPPAAPADGESVGTIDLGTVATSATSSLSEGTDGGAVDPIAVQQMPYLFQKGAAAAAAKPATAVDPSLVFAQPVGNAIVPGGAAQTPDVETLKKYLLLREQDVAVLSAQLQAAQDRIQTLEGDVRVREAANTELGHDLEEVRRKLADHDKDKQAAVGALAREIDDLRFEIRAKTDKARVLEAQVSEAAEDIEKLKERVRSDIRKIRVREKELENRLEIMKKDSEALIAARENKIIELKRKIDLLEFNMDLLQDQYTREKEHSTRMRERLTKASQVVRVAGALLDGTAERDSELKAAGVEGGADAKKREAS